MPKYGGRKQQAKILLERLTKGPSFVDIGLNSQTPMPDGSWGDVNEEVSSAARCACEHLESAIQIMTEPHETTKGADVLEALLLAQSSLFGAIGEYYR